jgi:hypothetical protein
LFFIEFFWLIFNYYNDHYYNHYYYYDKNHKFDLKDKIKNYKNFDKKVKETNKKLKDEGSN